MSILNRRRNYFFQLIISYVLLVIFITIIIGLSTSYYFTRTYNRELIQINQTMLYHINRIIEERILTRTQKIYDEIAIENRNNLDLHNLFNVPLEGNHFLIKSTFDYLYQLAGSNSDLIDSIHLYNVKNDIVISSRNGLVYPIDGVFNMDNLWLDYFYEKKQNISWLQAHNIGYESLGSLSDETTVVSFVRSYPAISGYEKIKGVICININTSAIYDIIIRQQDTGEEILIIDKDNQLIIDGKGIILPENFIDTLSVNESDVFNKEMKVNNIMSMISRAELPFNGWKTIHITPIRKFKRNLTNIKRMILIICGLSILIGFFITSIFSKRMYTPMRSILNRIRDASVNRSDQNEYTLINNTLDTLSNKVNTLEHTIVENKPLIKHNLISGLIRQTIRTRDDLQIRMDMLNYSFSKSNFYVILIDMKRFSIPGTSLQSSQPAKYNLIKILENYPDADSIFLATEISDFEIAIVANTVHTTIESLRLSLQTIIRTIFSRSKRFPITVIGNCVKTPMDIHISFSFAQKLQKYSYLFPNERFIGNSKISAREQSKDVIDPALLEEFSRSLKMKKTDEVTVVLSQILHEMKDGCYSYTYCYRKLTDIVTQVSEYTRKLNIELSNPDSLTIHQQFQQIESIDLFEEWLINLISETYNCLKERMKNKNYTAIEDARSYVLKNIETDLYLDNVAEYVSLKPHYFSKLFKEYTGTSFVTFVTMNKMKHAAELLNSTDLMGTEISDRLSFSSSAYFIKKFKAFHGMTPNEYRSRK